MTLFQEDRAVSANENAIGTSETESLIHQGEDKENFYVLARIRPRCALCVRWP